MRKYVYFIFMGVSYSVPSIRDEDTVNINLVTSKNLDPLNSDDEVLY